MITELNTTRFKKIGSKSFSFVPGLNVLRGPNWSGKSTTLNAIKFGLQSTQGIPGSKEDVPTWDTSGKCGVEVNIGNYRIVRELENCNIYEVGSDTPVATGHTACNSFLDELFGISVDNYNTLHFSDQGETAGLLTIGAATLQQMVEKIANVTLIDKVIKLANADASVLKGKLEGKTLTDTKELEKRIVDLTEVKSEIENGIATSLGDVEIYKAEMTELNKSLLTKAEELKKSEGAEHILSKLELRISNNKPVVTRLAPLVQTKPDSVELHDENIESFEGTISRCKSTLEEEEKNSNRYSDITNWLDNVSEKALQEEKNWISDTAEAKKEWEDAVKLKSEHEAEINKTYSRIDEINEEKASSICSKCERPFEENDEHKKALDEELEKLQSGLFTLEANYELIQDNLADARNYLETLESKPPVNRNVQTTINSLTKEAENLKEKVVSEDHLEKLRKDILKLSDEVVNLRAERLSANQKLLEYTSNLKEYNESVEIIKLSEERMALIKLDVMDTTKLKEEVENLQTSITSIKETINSIVAVVSGKQNFELPSVVSELARTKSELITAEESNKELRSNRKKKAGIVALVKYLRESRSRFLQSVWDRVLGYASTFCKTCTNDEIQGVVRDAKGKFKFVEDGVERPVTSASGAQRAFMGVGVRLGLAKALYGDSSFMVLDEPSSDMSVANSTRLVSALMGTGMQIIYSTHSDLEELSAGHVIDLGEMI